MAKHSPTKIPLASSNPSPPKETQHHKITQIIKQRTKPPSPPATRARSRSRNKHLKTKSNTTEVNNDKTEKQDKQIKSTPKQKQQTASTNKNNKTIENEGVKIKKAT